MPPATLSADPTGEEAVKSTAVSLPTPAQAVAEEANGQVTTAEGTKPGEVAVAAGAAAGAAVGAAGPVEAGSSAEGGGGGGEGEDGGFHAASVVSGAETTAAPMSGGDVADSSGLSAAGQELVGRQVS